MDLNQNNRKGRIVDKSKAWFKVQFPGDASVKSLQKKSLRAIPESQAAAPRTPAPPPAAAPAPDYEFDEAAAVAAPAPAPAPAPRLASPAAFLPDVPSWPTGDAAAPAAPPPGVAAAAPPPPPAGGPKKPASKPRGRVPAAPAAPAGVILPLAGAPPAGAPIRVRTAGGREAIVLEKMQRGWFRVELDQNANDEGGAGERKSMRRPHGFAPGQDHLLDAAPQAAFVPKPKGSGSSKGRKSSVQQSGPGPVPVGAVQAITAGGRVATILERKQRGWFAVELDGNANDEGGAFERKSMRRPMFAPGQDSVLDSAPESEGVKAVAAQKAAAGPKPPKQPSKPRAKKPAASPSRPSQQPRPRGRRRRTTRRRRSRRRTSARARRARTGARSSRTRARRTATCSPRARASPSSREPDFNDGPPRRGVVVKARSDGTFVVAVGDGTGGPLETAGPESVTFEGADDDLVTGDKVVVIKTGRTGVVASISGAQWYRVVMDDTRGTPAHDELGENFGLLK